MIVGTGIDIVSIPRVRALVASAGERFLHRWFSDEEVRYSLSKAVPAQHLAARLAAKEALVKALRTASEGPILLREITVTLGVSGAPSIELSGHIAELAARSGITGFHVSLSHDGNNAVASVIAVAEAPLPK